MIGVRPMARLAVLSGAAWAINLAVAEGIVRRRTASTTGAAAQYAVPSVSGGT